MANKRTYVCLLLLGALLLAACAGFSLGQANAHYENTDTWHTLLPAAAESGPVSNCLVSGGQTVLLGQMPLQQTQVPFTLAGESGSLRWSVDAEEYVSVEMLADGVSYTGETALELPAEGKTVTMIFNPSQMALETVHEAVPVQVEVSWTTAQGVYSAVFRVTLPEQTQLPTEPTEETTAPTEDASEPTEEATDSTEASEPAEDTTDPTEASEPAEDTTDPTEASEPTEETTVPTEDSEQIVTLTETEPTQGPTDPSDPTEGTTDPSDPTEGTTDPSDPTEGTTDPSDPTEGTTEPSEPTEGTTEPSEPTEETTEPSEPTEETTEPSDPTEETTAPTEPEEPVEGPVRVLLPGAYLPQQGLPMVATFPENTDRLVLQAADAQGNAVPFAPFTRYSTDGENWFLLYYGGSVELTLTPEQTRQPLILDAPAGEQLLLYAEIFDASGSLGYALASSQPLAESVSCEMPVLTDREELVLQLPEQWRGYEMQYSVSRLVQTKQRTENADGTYTTRTVRTYEPVELTKETLTAAYDTGTEEAPGHTLTLATGTPEEPKVIEQVLPAGTYCVEMTWTFEEFCLAQTRTVFFITYSSN